MKGFTKSVASVALATLAVGCTAPAPATDTRARLEAKGFVEDASASYAAPTRDGAVLAGSVFVDGKGHTATIARDGATGEEWSVVVDDASRAVVEVTGDPPAVPSLGLHIEPSNEETRGWSDCYLACGGWANSCFWICITSDSTQ